MLTADDKKFILMAINAGMVELAGTTADLIEGVIAEIRVTQKDVSILKHQANHTNKSLGLIRDDLGLVHRRVDYLEQMRTDKVNDTIYDVDLPTK